MSLQLINESMGADSYQILCACAKRKLAVKGCSLGDGYAVRLCLDDQLQNDRYILTPEKNGITLTAAYDCALHAAFGRFLLESRFDGRGGFLPVETPIDFTPKKALRGIYFATHFLNFYHSAPIAEVYEVIEDIALWGCNSLLVWFDMHHFSSMEEPGAQALVQRLHALLAYANRIGMGGSMIMLGNEAFNNTPEHLLARYDANGCYRIAPYDHYHLEICPSVPGGTERILAQREQMLAYFADLKIDYVIYWPYDQGGCTCEKCQPWGSNGFLKLMPKFQETVRKYLPEAKFIVSTWYFDRFVDGEWQGFYNQLKTDIFSDVSYIMAFFFRGEMPKCLAENGAPEGVEFIDFPEISMYSCSPWGGFGASVLTRFLQKTNDICASMYQGGFPYSEGIFEDANKFISLMSYSGLYPNAFDALRAYVRSEFCCEDEALLDAIIATETALARKEDKTANPYRCVIKDTSDIDFVHETLARYNATLPGNVTRSRNFRLFYLRSVIDYEMKEHDFYPSRSARCQQALKELIEIYHARPDSHHWVLPPYGK